MPFRMGAAGVEVTQRAVGHSVNTIHPMKVTLNHELAFPIGAARNNWLRGINRNMRRVIKQVGSRRQDKPFDSVIGDLFQ